MWSFVEATIEKKIGHLFVCSCRRRRRRRRRRRCSRCSRFFVDYRDQFIF
jgi:hypothetical protein